MMHKKITVFSVLVFLLLASLVSADIIELKDGTKSFGQFIALTPKALFFETIDKADKVIQTTAIPRDQVVTVTDETGIVLFKNGEKTVPMLPVYQQALTSNWEELKYRFKNSTRDSVFLLNGEKHAGHIISITEEALFLENKIDNAEKPQVKKLNLKYVKRINGEPVIFVDPAKPIRNPVKKIQYPVYSLNAGAAYLNTNYDQLENLFQQFYDSQNITYNAGGRRSNYLGLQLKLEMLLAPYISLGLTAHYFNYPDINSVGLTMAEVKYIFHKVPLRPWLGLGMAGQDISSKETVNKTNYQWRSSKSAVSLETGIDIGGELGYGFTLSAHYMFFGSERTKIDSPDRVIGKKIDFSVFMISINARFNFNWSKK